MAATHLKLISILFIMISLFFSKALSESSVCEAESMDSCVNKSAALPLKIIGMFSILIASTIGVSWPYLMRSIPALTPNITLFFTIKAFAAGIMLGTACYHLLHDSIDKLSLIFLVDSRWHEFPFTKFFSMGSVSITLIMDALCSHVNIKIKTARLKREADVVAGDKEMDVPYGANRGVIGRNLLHRRAVAMVPTKSEGELVAGDKDMGVASGGHDHGHHYGANTGVIGGQLSSYQVVAMSVAELRIIHSIVIGLALGASNRTCIIKLLMVALCFYKMFKGMCLRRYIVEEKHKFMKKVIMVVYSIITPGGIALGLAFTQVYGENSPTSLITVGLLNASSSGFLLYMAVIDFFLPNLMNNIKLQNKLCFAFFLGVCGVALIFFKNNLVLA